MIYKNIETKNQGQMANETKRDMNMTRATNGDTMTKPKRIVRKFPEGKTIPGLCLDCDICGEGEFKHRIKCPYCGFGCCKPCFDTYLLSTPGDSKCMSCKRIFDLDTVWKLCNNTIYKKYMDYKIDQLIQKEKSLFQESLVEIERENKEKKAKEMENVIRQFDRVRSQMSEFQIAVVNLAGMDKNLTEDMLESLGMNFNRIKTMKVNAETLKVKNRIVEDYNGFVRSMRVQTTEEKTEEMKQNTFIKHCSVADCKGTLNNRWYCRLCETPHCNKCGELKKGGEGERKAGSDDTEDAHEGAHVCDPNSVQNLEEIKKNSKGCPKCGVAIFKTEGCDQMFCIVCHTAFSWTTLNIETGRIHNPHYYEILRKNGNIQREEGDVRPCDELIRWSQHLVYVEETVLVDRVDKLKFSDTIRFINELDTIWNERHFTVTNQTFADIRKKFIRNQTTESEYRRQMKMKFNQMSKKFEVAQVLNITKVAMSEELKKVIRTDDGNLITRRVTKEELETKMVIYQQNFQEIVKNTNGILLDIGKKYTSHYEITFMDGRWIVIIAK